MSPTLARGRVCERWGKWHTWARWLVRVFPLEAFFAILSDHCIIQLKFRVIEFQWPSVSTSIASHRIPSSTYIRNKLPHKLLLRSISFDTCSVEEHVNRLTCMWHCHSQCLPLEKNTSLCRSWLVKTDQHLVGYAGWWKLTETTNATTLTNATNLCFSQTKWHVSCNLEYNPHLILNRTLYSRKSNQESE